MNHLIIIFLLLTFNFNSALAFEMKIVSEFNWNENLTTEIAVYDNERKLIFSSNPKYNRIDIFKVFDQNMKKIEQINLSKFGSRPNSIDLNSEKVLAVAMENFNPIKNGNVVFFDKDYDFIFKSEVGVMPDMITFNKLGNQLISANEGEPNSMSEYNPVGSLSIVDLGKRVSKTYDMKLFNNNKEIRKIQNGPLAEDLEPEYLSITHDEKFIFVVNQENNAISVFDYVNYSFYSIHSLGLKLFEDLKYGIDSNDKDKVANLKKLPIKGLYQPDGIQTLPNKRTIYEKFRGIYYLATANEGDSKDYSFFSEEKRISQLKLDEEFYKKFPNIDDDVNRLKVSIINADVNNDDLVDNIFSYGARSFSVWKFTSGLKFFGISFIKPKLELFYDSGDEFEKILSDKFPENFNTSFDKKKNELIFDARSDDKGPEPETINLIKFKEKIYAIIGLERSNGFFIYDVTDLKEIKYVKFLPTKLPHYSPEGQFFLKDKFLDKYFFLVSYEGSGSLVLYEIN